MILWRNIDNYPFLSIFINSDSDPRFPPFLLYVRWKSGVTFVRRCFRDGIGMWQGSGHPSKVGGFPRFSGVLHHVRSQ